MGRNVLEMFIVSLGLTWILEVGLCFLLGMWERKQIVLVLLVNLLTNPAVVLLCWLGLPQIPLELLVILVEGLVYRHFSRLPKWRIPNPLMLSAVVNGISWAFGVLIQR